MSRSLLFILIVVWVVWSCDKQSIQPTNSEENTPAGQGIVYNTITTGPLTEVFTSIIGPSGATVKVSKPNTPVDELQISIPSNSFSSTSTLKISYAEIKSHQFGTNFNPISPLISISLDGGYSNELMSVTIPVKIPAGHIPLGFYFDDTTGKLEGIPFKSIDSNSITLLTRHFLSGSQLKSGDINLKNSLVKGAYILVSSISEAVLKAIPLISSGFKPGIDDWEFPNEGSYIALDGHCTGQNIAAMWYYYEKKPTLGNLYNKFSDNAKLWQDNARGYRFCSVIFEDLDWNGKIVKLFDEYIDRNQELDKFKLLTIAGTMLVTGDPQGIGIYYQNGIDVHGNPVYVGHDLICYQLSVGVGLLYISDPNTPGVEQPLRFEGTKFLPYEGKINGHAPEQSFPYVTLYAKTAYIEWNKIGKRFDELVNNTIGTVAPNTFPSYTIWNKSIAGTESELKDGATVMKDTLRTMVTITTPHDKLEPSELHYLGEQLVTGCYVLDQNGDRIDTQYGNYDLHVTPRSRLYVILNPGMNKLGYYIVGWDTRAKDEYNYLFDRFIDFRWITVNYIYLKIEADQLKGEFNKEVKFTALSKGSAPNQAKYVWDFGDGSPTVTKTIDSTVVHTFTNTGVFSIKVELFDNLTNAKITEAKLSFNVIEVVIPTITTSTATSVTSTTAISGGIISSNGGAVVTARGVCWSANSNPTTVNNKSSDGTGSGQFSSSLSELTVNTTYYVRAYAINSVGTAYGNEISFKTAGNSPTITTTAVTTITSSAATSGGNITYDGGATITARGVCWSLSTNPTTANSKTSNGSGIGSFTSSLTSLSAGATYYVRAYATNNAGTFYGNEVTFKTSTTLPNVITTAASSVTMTTATSGGNVTSTGGATVTARGVCWSTTANPTTTNTKTSNGTGTGSFTSSIIGLTSNTTYYVRAYATNSVGTAYGSQVTFTTSGQLQLPTINTATVTSITTTTAISGGSITSDGGATVTARGVCWSTTANPTTTNIKTSNGTGTGSFTSSIIGLTSNTTYYVRSYATNSVGTAYGSQVTFTTSGQLQLPTIITTAATSITTTTATSGGNITSDGGANITLRGVCWNTLANPTTANNPTLDGAGIGSFTSLIIGLLPNTTYYIRAYATNSVGTAYGSNLSFTTTSIPSNTITDIDGNIYSVITIGTQFWLGSNLKTTRYNDGTTIPLVTDNTAWSNLATPGYCWYNNDVANKSTFGAIYNWYTVNTGKLCPTGWHVPSDNEWTILTTFLGGDVIAGGKLKETGTTHWSAPNTDASNSSGFTALPGGYRQVYGTFLNIGTNGNWWSSTENSTLAWFRYLTNGSGLFDNFDAGKRTGFSVRCVKN